MAFKVASDDKVEVSMEEFKKWLKKFDENRDGRISADELGKAIRATGGRFCKWKANRILKSIDTNSNGSIDDSEMSRQEQEMAIKVVPRVVDKEEKVEVSMGEFKKWLKKFDDERDERVSRKAIREAIRGIGGRFSKMKANHILQGINVDSDGFIDDKEISKLIVFAQKQFNLKIVTNL